MSRVTLAFPVESLQGKVNKQDSAYFMRRNGKSFMNRIINPFKGPMTAAQTAINEKFTSIAKQVSAILSAGPGHDQYDEYSAAYKANPGKYDTLRGYIFGKLYEKV